VLCLSSVADWRSTSPAALSGFILSAETVGRTGVSSLSSSAHRDLAPPISDLNRTTLLIVRYRRRIGNAQRLCENMTSKKPEVHDILDRRQRRTGTEPGPHVQKIDWDMTYWIAVRGEREPSQDRMYRKLIGTCGFSDMRADRRTYRHVRLSQYFVHLPGAK